MTVSALASPLPHPAQSAGGAEPSLAELAKRHPEAAQAAQQFESLFLRQLLNSVEKVSTLSGGSETQSAVVGSMMSGALSEQMSTAGGIGLSEVILRAMITHLPDPPAVESTAEVPGPAEEPMANP